MPITHAKKDAGSDSGDTSLVQPSDWNNSHDHPPVLLWSQTDLANTPNWVIPAAETEYRGDESSRRAVDLTHIAQVRLVIAMSTNQNGRKIRVQYSANGGSSWASLGPSNTPELTFTGSSARYDSGWVNVEAGARGEVLTRMVGLDGGASGDNNFGAIHFYGR